MGELMTFPETWEEFEQGYGFTDTEHIYTNGSRLIASFRVKQWLDHLSFAQPEIVRCKDCKYYLNSNEKCGLIDTRLHFYETDKTWGEDCFCSWAERRTDEDNSQI